MCNHFGPHSRFGLPKSWMVVCACGWQEVSWWDRHEGNLARCLASPWVRQRGLHPERQRCRDEGDLQKWQGTWMCLQGSEEMRGEFVKEGQRAPKGPPNEDPSKTHEERNKKQSPQLELWNPPPPPEPQENRNKNRKKGTRREEQDSTRRKEQEEESPASAFKPPHLRRFSRIVVRQPLCGPFWGALSNADVCRPQGQAVTLTPAIAWDFTFRWGPDDACFVQAAPYRVTGNCYNTVIIFPGINFGITLQFFTANIFRPKYFGFTLHYLGHYP